MKELPPLSDVELANIKENSTEVLASRDKGSLEYTPSEHFIHENMLRLIARLEKVEGILSYSRKTIDLAQDLIGNIGDRLEQAMCVVEACRKNTHRSSEIAEALRAFDAKYPEAPDSSNEKVVR
jgi:hypothetical protein